LLSDLEHAVEVVNRLLQEEGLQAIDREAYRKVFGFPVIEYYKKLGFDTSPTNFQKLCDRFNTYFHDGLANCDLWPGVKPLLTEIKAEGRTQSLLSASEHNYLLHSIRAYDVEHLFDNVFGVFNKLAASKVARGHELMQVAGIDPAHTIMIGDTDHDLEVGDALGIDVILVEHGHQCPTRLREVHHAVLKVLG
jgi:phosphoglycolate phosphatase